MKTKYEVPLFQAEEIRTAAVQSSPAAPFAAQGYGNGIVSIENGLDQNVTAQLQGKSDWASTWQDLGASVTVTASGVNKIVISEAWGELRLRLTAAGIPTTGDIDAWLTRVKAGAAVSAVTLASGAEVDVSDRAGRDLGKVDIAAIDVSLPAGTNNIGDVDVATIAAGETHIGEVGGNGITIAQTPTVTAGAYNAGDAVGGLLTFANAVRVSGGGGVIKNVLIVDDAGQDVVMELWLFNQTFVAMVDNAAWAPAEADLENCIGIISTDDGEWRAAGTPSAIDIESSKQYDLTGTSMFGQLVTRDTPTFVATDDVTVKIMLMRN